MSRLLPSSVAAIGLALATPATASVGLSCSIADKMLDLTLEGTISRGVGEGLISVQGQAKTNVAILSADLRSFSFERSEVTQYWLGRNDLKLRIYRESAGEPHETVDIVIEVSSKKDPDGVDYKGTYSLAASSMAGVANSEAKTAEFKGQVSCAAE